MTEDQFIELLQGFQERRLSEDELHAFLAAAGEPRFEALLGDGVYAALSQLTIARGADQRAALNDRADKVWNHIEGHISSGRPAARVRLLGRPWVKYAAAVLVLLCIGAYFRLSHRRQEQGQVAMTDVLPGREGAIVTLGDGRRVVLDSVGNGVVAEQNGTQVLLKNGSLIYTPSDAAAVSYNTMSTPNGRQFRVQLPDGSKAWLNAASSITYPTAFIGDERMVSVKGEVYLEVAKDAKKPFRVRVNDGVAIEVLGTSFDVKAYADDASINTTLLEGAVRVSADRGAQMLAPGQQTRVGATGEIQLIRNADLQKIMAWKNGLFNFQDESLEEVMKQLERWYDIRVRYMGDPPKKKFFGELGRDLALSQVLEALQEIGIQFRLEGRTLIVTP